MATAPTVKPVLYAALWIREFAADQESVSGAESIHCLLEQIIQTGKPPVCRLSMQYQRSTNGLVPRNFTAYNCGVYKSHCISGNEFEQGAIEVIGKGYVYSAADQVILTISRAAQGYEVVYKVLDSAGKQRYAVMTGPNRKCSDDSYVKVY